MSSGRGRSHVRADQLSSRWPSEETKPVKVAFKTENILTQDTAEQHKWISDQHLWF